MARTSVLSIPETRAFSIEEHEVALRWAALVKRSGYRVVVSLSQRSSEELLMVYRSDRGTPAFAIQRLRTTVVLIDCLGMTMRFTSLAEALLAMSPMSKSDRHRLLNGPRPDCVRELPPSLTEPRGGRGCSIAAALRHARRWAARKAGHWRSL